MKKREENFSPNNFLLAFYLDRAVVQGRFLRLESTLDRILNTHDYPSCVAYLLAEALSIATILIAQIKNQARVTLQMKTRGLIKLLVVDINNQGHLRGYADYDPVLQTEDRLFSFAELMGKSSVDAAQGNENSGRLVVTFDQGNSSPIFQGIVELQGDSLAESIMHYFKQSVQQDTYFLIKTQKNPQGKWQSATLFLQKNASQSAHCDEQWEYSVLLAQTIQQHEILNVDQRAHDFLIKIFHEQEIYFQPSKVIKAQCNCSRERIQQFVNQWTEQEKNELKEQGQLEIRCEFCNTCYKFV